MYKTSINIFICLLILMLSSCANLPRLKKPTTKVKITTKTEKVVEQNNFKISQKTAAAYNAALKHMRSKDYAIAIKEMKIVANMDKRISGPWVNIGLAHKGLDDKGKARAAFEKALAINPKNPYALNHLAIMYRKDGDFKKAEELYKKVLYAHPDYQNAHLNLGILCDLYLRKMGCALEHYQQYLVLTGGQDKQVAAWVTRLRKQGG